MNQPPSSDPALPRRRLGRTGLDVSILGFGTAPLGDLFARLDDTVAIAAMERAFALGGKLPNSLQVVISYCRRGYAHRC